jgi:Bifunctional DNA primase/polymerase, N-terminal
MGVFAENQPVYAEHGIATFPLNDNKRPAVKGWNKIGQRASREFAAKFIDANALGFVTNERNGLTVLDIDSTDEKVLANALALHGRTPMIVRTASGKAHAYYRHNGERRRIRPWDDLPIDVLGAGGLVVAPPTLVTKGEYRFIEGSLDDIDRLPAMRGLDDSFYVERPSAQPELVVPDDFIANDNEPAAPDFVVHDGKRGDELWRYCMRQAHSCESFDMLKAHAYDFNQTRCVPPMDHDRVVAAAASAWQYTERGQNRFGQHGSWLTTDEVNALVGEPNTLLLLTFLKANNGPDAEFMISNGLAEGPNAPLPMGLKALQRARDRLIKLGYVYQVRAAGGWDRLPALYRWRNRPRQGRQRTDTQRLVY